MNAEDRSPGLNPWAVVHLEVTLVRKKHREGAVRKADQEQKPEHVMFWKEREQCFKKQKRSALSIKMRTKYDP